MKALKTLNYFICALLFTSFSLVSCSDDDDNDLHFDRNNIDVIIGESEVVTVTNGDGKYTVTSSNEEIATVALDKKEVTIAGIKEGKVSIKVTDESGNTGIINVSVIKDPYEDDKADSTTRFVWNETSVIEGVDNGTYEMTQTTDGKVEFSWESEDSNSSVVFTFYNIVPLNASKDDKLIATLKIDGKAVEVTDYKIIQMQDVDGNPTIWVAFEANKKKGICVGQLS